MAFRPGNTARLFFGALHVSGYTRSANVNYQVTALDVTTLADSAKQFIPGQTSSSAAVDMVCDVDATATAQYPILIGYKAPASPTTPFTLAQSGYAAGSEALMLGSLETSLGITSSETGTVDLSMALTTDGETDYGVVLEPLAAVTGTTTGTARDGAAATANGGVAHLHVTAYATLTSDVVTIEHSVDGSTSWATLVTFTTVAGTTSQRATVAPGTTVRRYLRVVDTVTGSGSLTRVVSFARR